MPILPVVDLGLAAGLDQGPPASGSGAPTCRSSSRSGSRSPSRPTPTRGELTGQYKAVMADLLDVARAAYEPLTGPRPQVPPGQPGRHRADPRRGDPARRGRAAERQRRADERRGFHRRPGSRAGAARRGREPPGLAFRAWLVRHVSASPRVRHPTPRSRSSGSATRSGGGCGSPRAATSSARSSGRCGGRTCRWPSPPASTRTRRSAMPTRPPPARPARRSTSRSR